MGAKRMTRLISLVKFCVALEVPYLLVKVHQDGYVRDVGAYRIKLKLEGTDWRNNSYEEP